MAQPIKPGGRMATPAARSNSSRLRSRASRLPPSQMPICSRATIPSPTILPSISSRGCTLSSSTSATRFSFSLVTLWSIKPLLMVSTK